MKTFLTAAAALLAAATFVPTEARADDPVSRFLGQVFSGQTPRMDSDQWMRFQARDARWSDDDDDDRDDDDDDDVDDDDDDDADD